MTPDSTPREPLYIETGLIDIEAIVDIKRLNMMSRIKKVSSKMMDKVLSNPESKWKKKTRETLEKYQTFEWEMAEEKEYTKKIIKERVMNAFKERMSINQENKSKLKFFLENITDWTPGQPANYMKKLTRKQVSTIFKARTRMIKVKGNYKNGHRDLTCRACKRSTETQQHVLNECIALKTEIDNNYNTNPFIDDTNKLKIIAKEIDQTIDRIESDRQTDNINNNSVQGQ